MSLMKSTCSTPVAVGKLVPCPADFLAQSCEPFRRVEDGRAPWRSTVYPREPDPPSAGTTQAVLRSGKSACELENATRSTSCPVIPHWAQRNLDSTAWETEMVLDARHPLLLE